MSDLNDRYAFREAMVEALTQDLLGPSTEDETLDESPLDRYVTGVLYPAGRAGNDGEADEGDVGASSQDDTTYDPGVALALMKFPSSMGLSLSVDTSRSSTIRVSVTAARYTPTELHVEVADEPHPDTSPDPLDVRSRARRPRLRETWVRQPLDEVAVAIDVSSPHIDDTAVSEGLELFYVVRAGRDGTVPVTVVLRNTMKVPKTALRDPFCWFQPQLTVTTDPPAIVDRRSLRSVAVDDEDLDSYDLLFRDSRSFAVGHGCSAEWDMLTGPLTAEVRSTFIPSYELPLSTPTPPSDAVELHMHTLATSNAQDVERGLRSLVSEYRLWIDSKSDEADQLAPALRDTAHRHLRVARDAANRIDEGIDLLVGDGKEFEAFQLMNRAMRDQRARQDWIRNGSDGSVPDGGEQRWRPFQMAFILLNLRGLADPAHPDRAIADLLWFPTGGGKTEAYLGLIAFITLLRRLRDPNDRGVAVIMRYTLRLLTLQQFERAATLICALEAIRADHPHLSATEPITLGLWVGQGATPNNIKDARRGLNRLKSGLEPEAGNPMQLTRCPWCGIALDVENYRIDRLENRLRIACDTPTCRFSDGLPLYLVDDDVYQVRPSLLIGTVDKFAMMAWKEAARAIFAADGDGNPPDLIVQDELHLISGPLGTMVGLYEAAVEAAAGRIAPPKVIASTATIRRARAQMRAVFDRDTFQFPPPGLDLSDSFFAVEAPREEKGTRRYVGVLAPGTSQTTLLVRTYAALLQAAADIPGTDESRDPYWTLVGYFNSLRVLGGAFMQVIDDVPDRMRLLASRSQTDQREISSPTELTSRVRSSEIPEALAQLAEGLPSPNAPDVVLATNMISVGMDIDRLGLMAVMGQPQATAEYIQSTSRIGRQHPGLAVVMYNSARSRDRSHYENFLSYHQALYREVEATSATPFAVRARDRGLHGVLVSMARLLLDRAASNLAAGDVADFADDLEGLAQTIVDRARRIDPDTADETEQQLDELIQCWIDDARAKRPLTYSAWNDPATSLLVDAGRALTDPDLSLDTDETPWPTLRSLRDVDAESSLYLIPNRERKPS